MKLKVVFWVRGALLALGIGTLLVQVLVVVQARETGFLFPEVEHLVVPYSIAGILTVAAVQVGLVALWMIVSAIARGSFYQTATLRWIEVLRWVPVPAATIPSLVALHLLVMVGVGGPGVVLGLMAALVSGAAGFVLVTLGRQVYLIQAAEHAELETVI